MQNLPPTVRLMGIGWYVALCIVLGVVGGLVLDGALDTGRLFTLLGLGVGLTAALWGGFRLLIDTIGGLGKNQKKGSQ